MYRKFTQRARNTVLHAQEEARGMGHPAIGTEHILLGLLREGEGVGARALANLGLNLEQIRNEVKNFVGSFETGEAILEGDLPVTPRVKKVFNGAFNEAREQGVNYVGTEHLLLALIREEEGVAGQVLTNLGIRSEDIKENVIQLLGGEMNFGPEAENLGSLKESPGIQKRKVKSKTPTLDQFSRDLTRDAQIGRASCRERV